jgi:hypothetical protein
VAGDREQQRYNHPTKKSDRWEGCVEMVALVGIVFVVLFVVPLIFQLLWNITVPEIFGLPTIRYWQAFRLLLMASMIFGANYAHFNK